MNTESQEEKRSPGDAKIKHVRRIQRVLLILAAATLILGIYFFRGDIYDYYMKVKTEQQIEQQRENTVYSRIAFEPDSTNIFALFGNNLAVLNRSTFKLYSPAGEELLSRSLGFNSPGMAVCDSYAAVYDRDSGVIEILDSASLLGTIDIGESIISASINKNGFLAVTGENDLYRTCVSVYNAKHKLIYEWKNSEYYVMSAAVSPDNSFLAVAAYTQSGGSFVSRIIFFDLSSEEYYAQRDIEDSMVTNINFVSSDVLIAVGDDMCAAVSVTGDVVYTYSYGNDKLKSGAQSEKTVLLSFVDRSSGLGAKLVTFGPESYSISSAADEIREISIAGDYAAVLYTQSIQVFNTKLEELTDEIAVSQVRKIIINQEGQVMMVYTSDAGYIDLLTAFMSRG